MAKILISDLFGTLIPETIAIADHLYGKETKRKDRNKPWADSDWYWELLDDIFVHLRRDLTPFFEEGNYLKIVSLLEGHESLDFILDVIIPKVYKNLHKYKNQIELFLCTESQESKPIGPEVFKKPYEQYEKNKIAYYKYDNNFVFGIIQNKVDVYDIIKQTINIGKDEIYCIGDSEKDFSMLVKCINLGGISSLIRNNLWTYSEYQEMSADDIILNKAKMDYQLMIEQKILSSYPDYSYLDWSQRRDIRNQFQESHNWGRDWIKIRLSELYTQLNAGNLDLYKIFQESVIYGFLSTYWDRYLEMKTFTENSGDKLNLYSTFRDFSNNMLMRKRLKN